MAPAQVEETPSKTVQELPKNYIYKGGDAGTLGASLPYIDIPTIDFSLLSSPTSGKQELEKLCSALTSWGCVQIINHGIDPAFMDKVDEVGKQFFGLPVEEKKKYARENGGYEGYSNHIIDSKDQAFDWIDRLYLVTKPEDKRQLKLWPENPQSFREILHEYTAKIEKLNEMLLKAIARALTLEENCFLDMYGEDASMLSIFNLYPPCPRPDLAIGLKPHADASVFTYLMQDKEVEGLQFQKDDQWYKVPVIPGAFVINVGDQIEIMSNGIFKSPIHRVVTNTEKGRMSLVMFCFPNPNKEIEPVKGLVTETRPRLYKTMKDYTSILVENYQKGRRPIEAAKI
ncbi:Fe2OG dioxygenase domain-containing protein [Citrus sinensis]|uniref:Fe2OG dioxygenase domain-containing protein n=1 Tax=Citrus sinensis TaxID=2711 RepID=A0ACB8JKM2_CITSI|nr:Fe2OG dioxygenase domain-containing protein [Citrus sinensis]